MRVKNNLPIDEAVRKSKSFKLWPQSLHNFDTGRSFFRLKCRIGRYYEFYPADDKHPHGFEFDSIDDAIKPALKMIPEMEKVWGITGTFLPRSYN